jgi:hypothetical protein
MIINEDKIRDLELDEWAALNAQAIRDLTEALVNLFSKNLEELGEEREASRRKLRNLLDLEPH